MSQPLRALRYGLRLAAAAVRWRPRRLLRRRRAATTDRPLIIALVTAQVTARETKIGRGLRLTGHRPILLTPLPTAAQSADLPAALQDSERAEEMQEAIDFLQEAIDTLKDLLAA